jgi:flagellar biosynthetic protein FlhB
VFDLAWSRFSWRQDLRMTKQEVKDEYKQSEGDPVVKMRLRSAARNRARQRMMSNVPRATLVIANPTHYSIALRYVREEDSAPVVLAKGTDLVALRIREIAQANGIPIFEDVMLARSMYKQVSVDTVIPPQFYQAVAELVRIVYGKQGQGGAARVQR